MSRFERDRGRDDDDREDERDSRSSRYESERGGGGGRPRDEFGRDRDEFGRERRDERRDDRPPERERDDRRRYDDRERGRYDDRGGRDDGYRRKRGRDDYENGGGRRDDFHYRDGPPRGGDRRDRHDDYGGGGYKHRRHSGDYRAPPRHRSPPPREREPRPSEQKTIDQMLTELLLEIGNPNDGPLEGNLEELSNVLKQDLADNESLIIKLMLDCVVELPAQTPVYGTLAGLLNAASEEFGAAIVAGCIELLQKALDGDEVLQARMLTRFLAELLNASAIHPDSLLSAFTKFVEHALEAGAADGPKQQADFLVALVLEALIWAGRTLHECRSREVGRLLGRVDEYMAGPARPTDFSLVRAFEETAEERESTDLFKPTDFVGSLHKVVRAQRAAGWRCDATLKPYQSFEAQLGEAKQHRLPEILIPGFFEPAKYRLRMVHRIFDADIDDMRPVDRLVCETHLIDTMQLFDFDHEERDEKSGGLIVTVKEAAWRLVGGIDRRKIVPVLPSMMPKEQLDKLICETIFGQMFQLPSPPMPNLYYSTLLSHLVKLDKHRKPMPEPFAAMLVFTIECIFEQLDTMDVTCRDIFATWFAHHLSNQTPAWKWDWSKWAEVLEMPETAPRRLWVQDVLDRATRLSFHEHIRRSLTGPAERFQALMPPLVEAPGFKYSEGTDALAAVPFAPELHEKMLGQERVPPKEIVNWLEETVLPSAGEDGKGLGLDAAIHCCLQAGTDPTHLNAVVARHMPLLEFLGARDRLNTPRVLGAVTEFWATSNQHLVLTVLRLLSMRIVPSPAALINFVFDDSNLARLERSSWWEIIRIALAKTVSRSQQVATDLAAAKEELSKAPAPDDDDSDEDMGGDEDVAAAMSGSDDEGVADGAAAGGDGAAGPSRAQLERKVEKIEEVQDTVVRSTVCLACACGTALV